MPSMDTFTIITTNYLVWLNGRAKWHKRERTLSPAFLSKVDEGGIHVVASNFLVDPDTVRITLLVAWKDHVQPMHATLDLSYGDFRELPRFGYTADGSVEVIEAKRGRGSRQARIAAKKVNEEWERPLIDA